MPLITVTQDRFGNLEVDPVNARSRARAIKHLASFKAAPRDGACLVYLQGDAGEEFLTTDLSRRAARDVRAGWTVRARVSADLLCALVGYDFDGC
jgi:hypothetical protein